MSWFSRLKNALNPGALEEDVAEEMRDHLERRAAALEESGLSAGDARQQAQGRFGSMTRLREESREVRLSTAVEGSLQDARYAWRTLRRNPVFAATVILSLGLAIGANTAIFSIVDAAILRPLAVPHPERLFTLAVPAIEEPGRAPENEGDGFSYPVYQQFRAAAAGSARLALFGFPELVEAQTLDPGAPLERLTRQFVSGDAFEILGVTPALGRLFSEEDDRTPGAHAVGILSHDYWRRRFREDPGVLGRTIAFSGKHYTVIGVAREGFSGVEPGRFVDLWLPAKMYTKAALNNFGWQWFRIVGRLSPGATREQIAARLRPAFHDWQIRRAKWVPTMPESIRQQFVNAAIRTHPAPAGVSKFRQVFGRPLWIVFGIAAGILLIACANAASLLLARWTARAPEIAMRVSLGAARVRLVRQLLMENLMLSLLAGGLGWLIARLSAPALAASLSKDHAPVRFALAMDSRVLLFCFAVSLLAAIGFGAIPAWQASKAPPHAVLRAGSQAAGKLRLGRFFVAVQVAFAFSLVMVGFAFLFSLRKLGQVNAGFDPRGVVLFRLTNETATKPEEFRRQAMSQLLSRIGAQPGIEASAAAPWAVFEGSGWREQVMVRSKPPSEREEIFYPVSPRYFAALKMPLWSGRDFEWHDGSTAGPTPTIINRAFAEKYFAGTDPLGKQFRHQSAKAANVVVGVVADARYTDLRTGTEPIAYLPLEGDSGFALHVRSRLSTAATVRIVEREALAAGLGTRVHEITTLETVVGNTVLRERLLAGIGGTFALLGVVLAAIGLFGLLNYSVQRRTREIGVRAALGARQGQIVGLVLRETVAMVAAGLMAGLAIALVAMKFFQSLLYEVRPTEPLVILTAAGIVLIAALAASGFPARRAAAVDPLIALRWD